MKVNKNPTDLDYRMITFQLAHFNKNQKEPLVPPSIINTIFLS